MIEKRGRTSEAERQIANVAAAHPANVESFVRAPKDLGPAAANLWRSIVASRSVNFFGPGDWPLLREYCHTAATLIPHLNELLVEDFDLKLLDARDKQVRLAAGLARSLRLCVSSRTRGDLANMRDGGSLGPLWT